MQRRMLFLLTVVAALGCSLAHAQLGDPKLISASYDYYPYAQTAGDSEASFSMFKLNAAIPIEIAEDSTVFIPGLRYTMLDVMERHESGRAERSVDALYTMLLKAALWQRIDDDISLLAAVSGGLASDLATAPSSKDWVFSAHVIGLWEIMPEFTLGGGIGYDRRTGDLAPLPLLAIDWQPSSRFMLRGVAPESLAARYRVVPWLSLGVEGSMEGERYHLTEATSGREDAELAYSLIKAGVAATVHWGDFVHTRAYGGATLHRRFEVFLDDESQGDLRVQPGPYAGVELWIGPSGWKAEAPAQAQAL